MEGAKVSGVDKAAILLLFLGEDVASNVLRKLNDDEIRLVSRQMVQLRNVGSGVIDDVIDEFSALILSPSLGSPGDDQYVKRLLLKALGDEKARPIIQLLSTPMFDDQGGGGVETPIIESLRKLDPEAISNLVRNEHPQTTALILSHLSPDQVSKVIPLLPEESQSDVVIRIATLDRIPPGAIDEIEDVLRAEIRKMGIGQNRSIGGMEPVADMMNRIDRTTGNAIMVKIEEEDPDLAEEIKRLMLVFDDLVLIDKRGMQMVLKEVSNEDITLALKTASDAVKEHILGNVSERAAAMIQEDLEALGPVRVKDVEKAQQSIIAVASKLADEGKIFISGRGGEDIVV
ncbi:MAG: flagellar motor switch protein FliG [Pseudomonadota bacterium]